jgi:hypothetical protein
MELFVEGSVEKARGTAKLILHSLEIRVVLACPQKLCSITLGRSSSLSNSRYGLREGFLACLAVKASFGQKQSDGPVSQRGILEPNPSAVVSGLTWTGAPWAELKQSLLSYLKLDMKPSSPKSSKFSFG